MGFPMGLRDYVRMYTDFLSPQECVRLMEVVADAPWSLHQFYNVKEGTSESYDKELSVAYADSPEVLELHRRVWFAIEQYIVRDFGFMKDWFCGWNEFSPVRFNRYEVGTQMKGHCDHIHSLFDGTRKGVPILSVLGALNDDYEGGELLFWGGERVELKAGSVMLFPSNFMYPHEVKEVTRGTRYSFVSWVW